MWVNLSMVIASSVAIDLKLNLKYLFLQEEGLVPDFQLHSTARFGRHRRYCTTFSA